MTDSIQNSIQFTQGNFIVLTLYATDGNGNPVDITGGVFSTQMRGPNGDVATFPDGDHVVIDGPGGEFTLTLDENDSASVNIGANKDIVTKITQSGKPLSYRGDGILQVFPAEPVA